MKISITVFWNDCWKAQSLCCWSKVCHSYKNITSLKHILIWNILIYFIILPFAILKSSSNIYITWGEDYYIGWLSGEVFTLEGETIFQSD